MADLPTMLPTRLDTLFQQCDDLPSCVPTSLKRCLVVQECQPVVHRLRLSASPMVPTSPERTNLPQETLGFRRKGFSPFLSLLIPAFSLPTTPAVLSVYLQRCWNAPLPCAGYLCCLLTWRTFAEAFSQNFPIKTHGSF